MRIPDPKANTTTEAYLAYKAGYLEESELKPVLYEPYLHFDAWLAYWAGLTSDYPHGTGKNLTRPFVEGKYDDEGKPAEGQAWRTPDLIPVGAGEQYIFSNNGSGLAINLYGYNSKKEYVMRIGSGAIPSGSPFTVPEGIAYVAGWRGSSASQAQLEKGDTITEYEPYNDTPEMLTDEEALVAYLSGVTNTYPEEIKDPYDVRIVGYLKYLVSARWGRPDYPVNNEEFYLSTMKPPVVKNDTPSADIELDDTAEAPFIDVKAYGDTSQTTYTGKNLFDTSHPGTGSPVEVTGPNSIYLEKPDKRTGQFYLSPRLPAGSYTLSYKVSKNATNTEGVRCNISVMKEDGSGAEQIKSATVFDGSVSISFTSTTEVSNIYWFIAGTLADGSSVDVYDIQLEKGSTATSFEPYVGGIPAPSPDYPQSVNVVTGLQSVETKGRNLLGKPKNGNYTSGGLVFTTDDDKITGSGVITVTPPNIFGQVTFSRDLSPGTYTFSIPVKNEYSIRVALIDTDGNWHSDNPAYAIPAGELSKTITTDFTAVGYRVCISGLSVGQTIDFSIANAFQLEEGESRTDYIHYGRIYDINLGKNLFDKNNPNVIVGTVEAGGYNASGSNKSFYLKCESNTTYTIQKRNDGDTNRFIVATANTIPVQGTAMSGLTQKNKDSSVTITTGNDAKYIVCTFYRNTEAILTEQELIDSIQVEVGSTVTPYSPYFEPIELCKIGDYQDYIYRDADGDWYVHKAIGKFAFNGSEDWLTEPYGTNTWRLPNVISIYDYDADEIELKCDFSSGVAFNNRSLSDATNTCVCYTNSNSVFVVRNTTMTTKEAMQTATAGKRLFYKATPTDTQITNSELISQLDALMEGGSYEGKTYIKVTATDPNLPGLLYVEAGKYD